MSESDCLLDFFPLDVLVVHVCRIHTIFGFYFSEVAPPLDRAHGEPLRISFSSAMNLTNSLQCKLIWTLLLTLVIGKRVQRLQTENGGLLVPNNSNLFSRATSVGVERRSACRAPVTVLSAQLLDRATLDSSDDIRTRI